MASLIDDDERVRALFGARRDEPRSPAEARAKRRVLADVVGGHAPRQIGERYTLGVRLGAGGMGVVHEGHDTRLGRAVAIKRVRGIGGARDVQRLESEARTLAALSHPNIVTVHDIVVDDGEVFVVMERVEGRSVRQWQTVPPRRWSEVVEVFVAAGRGLAAAHAAGVVHCDFKPSNVMIGSGGVVKVIDFGLARLIEHGRTESGEHDSRSVSPTSTRGPGTRGYMAPEQRRGEIVEASDQFSVGVSLFECVVGSRPFDPNDPHGLRDDRARARVRQALAAAGVPTRARRAIVVALDDDRAARFASVESLLAEIEPTVRRGRWTVLVGGLGVAAVAVAGTIMVREPPCAVRAEIDQAWSESRRAQLETALSQRHDAATVQRLSVRLAHHVTQWQTRADALCGTPDATAERLCLHHATARVDALLLSMIREEVEPADPVARLDALAQAECGDGPWAQLGARPEFFTGLGPQLEAQISAVFVRALDGDVDGQREHLASMVDSGQFDGVALAWLRMRLAHAHNIAGDYVAAVAVAEDALSQPRALAEPGLRASIEVEAAFAMTQLPGRAAQALALAEGAVAVVDNDPGTAARRPAAWGTLSMARLTTGDPSGAVRAAEQGLAALAAAPPSSANVRAHSLARAELLHLRGLAQQDVGAPKQAVESMTEALLLVREVAPRHPDHGRILGNRGRLRSTMGDPGAADDLAEALERLNALGRDDSAAMVAMALGNLHLRGGRFDDAIVHFDDAQRRLPDDAVPTMQAELHYNRAIAQQGSEQWRAAAQGYGRALTILRSLPSADRDLLYGAHLGRGVCLAADGQAARARSDLERAAQLEPPSPPLADALDLRLALVLAIDEPTEARAAATSELAELLKAPDDATARRLRQWRRRFESAGRRWPVRLSSPDARAPTKIAPHP